MARLVQCVKLGRPLPGLEKPPFPGPLGQRIYDQVSAEAWRQWQAQLTIMINHYGLNLLDPATRAMLDEQMEEFFFGENAQLPQGWVAPGARAPAKGGGPRKK